jgi:hypothetical protein
MVEVNKKIERTGTGNPPLEITKAMAFQIRLGDLIFWARSVIREDGGVSYEKVLFCEMVKELAEDSSREVRVWSLYEKLKIFTIGGNMILEYTPAIALSAFLSIPEETVSDGVKK